MYNLYNYTADEWQALEKIKRDEYLRGYKDGRASQGRREAFNAGRAAGFAAGYVTAQEQPQAKIEAAYEQGYKAGISVVEDMEYNPLLARKNGVGY